MNTIELTNVPGYEGQIITIKKLGYGSLTQLRGKITKTSVNSKEEVSASVDMGLYQKWLVVYGVVSAPFFDGKTIDERAKVIDEDVLDGKAGQFLFDELQKINGFGKQDDIKKE